MDDAGTGWPLSDEQRTRVLALGELIRRGGAARFLHGHVVCANATDFPEPWEATRNAVHRLLYRLYWHAYLDLEIVLEDARVPAPASRRMLTTSAIDLLEVGEGKVTYQVAAIGNDDVAGLATHSVGAAYFELAPADPFRGERAAPGEAEASIAACYLGLGVLVANASMYRRHESRISGRQVVSENKMETTGGLSIGDATLLLAVQLLLRDDLPAARETLHPPQQDWLARWLEVLDPHEAELRTWLGLDHAEVGELPARPGEPRVPPAVPELALTKHNAGRVSFRIPIKRRRGAAGFGLGLLGSIVCAAAFGQSLLWFVLWPIGTLGGWLYARPGLACNACRTVMVGELPTCPSCGVSLPETLQTPAEQKARRAEYAALAEAADPELAAEAEAAYSDQV